MKTVLEHLRSHLERDAFPQQIPTLDELRRSEWSSEFEQLMRNRLVMGAFRYGLFADPDKFSYRCLDSIRKRLELFETDNNLEHLVDCANLCMVEFIGGQQRGLTLEAADDVIHVDRNPAPHDAEPQ